MVGPGLLLKKENVFRMKNRENPNISLPLSNAGGLYVIA